MDENKDNLTNNSLENTIITNAPITPDVVEEELNNGSITGLGEAEKMTSGRDLTDPTFSNQTHSGEVKIESGARVDTSILKTGVDNLSNEAPMNITSPKVEEKKEDNGTPFDINGGNFTNEVEKPKTSGIGRTISLIFVFGILFGYLFFFDTVNQFAGNIKNELSSRLFKNEPATEVVPTPTPVIKETKSKMICKKEVDNTATSGLKYTYVEEYNFTNSTLESYKTDMVLTRSGIVTPEGETEYQSVVTSCSPELYPSGSGASVSCDTTEVSFEKRENFNLLSISKYNNGGVDINTTTTEDNVEIIPPDVIVKTDYTLDMSVDIVKSDKESDFYTCEVTEV